MRRPDGLPHPLDTLFADIVAARAERRRQAAQKVRDLGAQAAALQECLRALEAFADALEHRRLPVPRQIQQDIRLHRALCRLPRR
ncbi:hypothetical protein [Jiangella sp. DSM 45060]|uniref:hypothetical protein n=1 Tax=Jiangella sp. DSM 45060 TaxID=1798224 RepID=UPI0008798FE6|nr:hypothetical protein [Jiangella sp. DSM 45060]SDT61254.1 hypothetical protein SAMN04515669_5109 [Jiangella sp. DSM 45060]